MRRKMSFNLWSIFFILLFIVNLYSGDKNSKRVSDVNKLQSPIVSSAEKMNPQEFYRLSVTFGDTVSAASLSGALSDSQLQVERFEVKWGGHTGWYYTKPGQSESDALKDFAIQHRNFIEEMIEQLGAKSSSDPQIQQVKFDERNTVRLRNEFENQLFNFQSQGLKLTGAVLKGKGSQLNGLIQSGKIKNARFDFNRFNEVEVQNSGNKQYDRESVIRNDGEIQSDRQCSDLEPSDEDRWKFPPDKGLIQYDAAQQYFYSQFSWSDLSLYSELHQGYGHEFIIAGSPNTYIDRGYGLYYTNLPGSYIDNLNYGWGFSIIIGSSRALDLELNKLYYTRLPIRVIDPSKGPTFVDINAGTYSYAGAFDDGDCITEAEEVAICNSTEYKLPENCLYPDYTITIGNRLGKIGSMYFNSDWNTVDIPFQHQVSQTYYWDKNYDPNSFTCPKGKFRGKYYNIKPDGNLSLNFIRCDDQINFDWVEGSPAPSFGADRFQVLWEGEFDFSDGITHFYAAVDDGIRVFLDGSLILESWQVQPTTEFRTSRYVAAGTHKIRVDYFENLYGAVINFNWEQDSIPSFQNPSLPTSVTIPNKINFSGNAVDDRELRSVNMVVSGPKGNNITGFSYDVNVTDVNLSSYYFDSNNTTYAGIPGNYTVTLWIADTSNQTVSRTFNVTVSVNDQLPTFENPSLPSTVTIPNKIYFSGNAKDDKGLKNITMLVSGPKGNNITGFSSNVEGTVVNLSSYSFDTSNTTYAGVPGNYSVTLWIKDTADQTISRTFNVTVSGNDQSPYFENASLPSTVTIPNKIYFSGNARGDKGLRRVAFTVSGPKGNNIAAYSAYIGGTNVSLTPYSFDSNSMFYASVPGNYTVTLTITDSLNQTASKTFNVTVVK